MILLAAVAIAHMAWEVSISALTRDVSTVAGVHPLTGMVSNLGILLWSISAATSGFAAAVLSRVGSTRRSNFFFASCMLSAYLMLDDLFQIHEFLLADYAGVPEAFTVAAIAASAAGYLFHFRDIVTQLPMGSLTTAMIFFCMSIVIDLLVPGLNSRLGEWSFFVEDGLKWMGISCWCGYLSVSALHCVLAEFSFRSSMTIPS